MTAKPPAPTPIYEGVCKALKFRPDPPGTTKPHPLPTFEAVKLPTPAKRKAAGK